MQIRRSGSNVCKSRLHGGQLTSIDDLMDTIFASHVNISAKHLLDVIRDTAESIGALEAQMWIYEYLADATQ